MVLLNYNTWASAIICLSIVSVEASLRGITMSGQGFKHMEQKGLESVGKRTEVQHFQNNLYVPSLKASTQRMLKNPEAHEIDNKMDNFGRCEGDCDEDADCSGDLVCLQRDYDHPIPGCDAANHIIDGKSDFCVREEDREEYNRLKSKLLDAKYVRNEDDEHTKEEKDKLGECEGDCDKDSDCKGELVCQLRRKSQGFDGCNGGEGDNSESDYCVRPEHHKKLPPLFGKDDNETSVGEEDTKVIDEQEESKPRNDPPWVVSTSSSYGSKGEFSLDKPRSIQEDDTLVLFLSRTDDPLPLEVDGWETEASCFKQDNGQRRCLTVDMCRKRADYDRDYCAYFNDQRHNGHDLATVVFSRRVTRDDVDEDSKNFVQFKLPGMQNNIHPGWAILVAVRNADGIRGWSGMSCDNNDRAVFESVEEAKEDDLLMLHFAFDDTTTPEMFQAPLGTRTVAYTVGSDEASLLYIQEGLSNGPTGRRETRGPGGPRCKDVNLSVVVKKK